MKCPICQSYLTKNLEHPAEVKYESLSCPKLAQFKSVYFSHYTAAIFPDKKEEWIYLPPYQVIVTEKETIVGIHVKDTSFKYVFSLPGRLEVGDPTKLSERLKALTPFL